MERALESDLSAQIDSQLAALRAALRQRALADGTFHNLFLFRRVHDYVFRPGEHPCIAGHAYDGTTCVLPLFDIGTVPYEALTALLYPGECFFPIPEEVVATLSEDDFSWTSKRDDADYVYPAEQFLNYEAPGLRAKRAQVRRLAGGYLLRTEPISRQNRGDALRILEGWCADKGKGLSAADGMPCREALFPPTGIEALPGFIHYADGRPAGFLLTEVLNAGVEVVRFAKGRREFDGIFPHMFQDLSRRRGASLQWLNFEQDLGIAGFRQSKLSYRPAMLLSKYRVHPRTL